MLTSLLTVLTLIVVYVLQQGHPVIAGIVTVAPVKIAATSPMVFENGGILRIQEALPAWRSGSSREALGRSPPGSCSNMAPTAPGSASRPLARFRSASAIMASRRLSEAD